MTTLWLIYSGENNKVKMCINIMIVLIDLIMIN
jgi:hypothetical protein